MQTSLENSRGDSPKKVIHFMSDDHVASAENEPVLDENGSYTIPDGTPMPELYDGSDVEIITPEYEKMVDSAITKKYAKRK